MNTKNQPQNVPSKQQRSQKVLMATSSSTTSTSTIPKTQHQQSLAPPRKAHGYFHHQFPPCFVFTYNSKAAATSSLDIPAENHLYPKSESTKRFLQVVHPSSYLTLRRVLNDNWNKLFPKKSSVIVSLSRIESVDSKNMHHFEKHGSTIILKRVKEQRLKLRAKQRMEGSYLLQMDISNFYGSIYTHSLPWALVGRPTARANKSDNKVWYNQIDKAIRSGQNGQTIGIPVGPAASLLLGEIVLTALDKTIEEALEKQEIEFVGFRIVDDYELVFKEEFHCKEALNTIQRLLQGYGLTLNANKTKIHKLPSPMSHDWFYTIDNFHIPADSTEGIITNWFNVVLEQIQLNPNHQVATYSVARMMEKQRRIKSTDVKLYLFQLICQIVKSSPQTIDAVLSNWKEDIDKPGRREAITLVLNDIMGEHASKGNSNEVVWALFAAYYLDIPVKEKIMKRVSRIQDSFVAVLALQLNKKYVKKQKTNGVAKEEQGIKGLHAKDWIDMADDEHWLLSHCLPTLRQYVQDHQDTYTPTKKRNGTNGTKTVSPSTSNPNSNTASPSSTPTQGVIKQMEGLAPKFFSKKDMESRMRTPSQIAETIKYFNYSF